MTDSRAAALRNLWGRQLYRRQDDPAAWAEGVLRATGLPVTAVTAAMAGELDALPVDGAAHLLFRTVAKVAADLRGNGMYDADSGERIGPLALCLAEREPRLAGTLRTALGHPPDGPDSLVSAHAADLRGDRPTRLRAVDALLEWAELGDAQALAALHAVATDHRVHDPAVWDRALGRIALFGDGALEPGLLRAVADTRHRGVRRSALACAELGLARAVPSITALLGHADGAVREGACRALGLLAAPAAVPGLAARLDDEVRRVRITAAGALGRIGGEPARAVLWRAMTERPDPRAGHLASAVAALGPAVLDDLVTLATAPDPDLRALACRALGATGDARALPVLQRLASHDHTRTSPGGTVATTAARALGTTRRPTPTATPPAGARPRGQVQQ
ncbi:HEAT repeat domain-containing protein [Kitasatospora sp. NPDC093679]|uniref:HEAT repeat domain-containing protein n=1 Tax=Kitasatospora sp. NPDC093679 TaxID=3154983 RepID=UPI003442F758